MPCHWGALFSLVKNYNTISEEHVHSCSVRRYKKNDRITKVTVQRRHGLDDDENIESVDIDSASFNEDSGGLSGSHNGSIHSKMSQGSFVYNDSVKRLLSQDKKQNRGKLQDIFNIPFSEETCSNEKFLVWDPLWLKRVQRDHSESSQYLPSHSRFSARAASRSAHSYIQSRNNQKSSFECSTTFEKEGQKSKKVYKYKRNISMCRYVPKAVRNLQSSSALNGEKIDDFFLKCRDDDEQIKFASTEKVSPRVVSDAPEMDLSLEDLVIMNDELKKDAHDKQQKMDGIISEMRTVSQNPHKASLVHDSHNIVLQGFDNLYVPSRNANDTQHKGIAVESREGYMCLSDSVRRIRSLDNSVASGFTNDTGEIHNQSSDTRQVTILREKCSKDDIELLVEYDKPSGSHSLNGTSDTNDKILEQPGMNPDMSEVTPDVEMMIKGDSVLHDGPVAGPSEKMPSLKGSISFTSDHLLDMYAVVSSSSSSMDSSHVRKSLRDVPCKGNADVLY